jgi:hypothetical protein
MTEPQGEYITETVTNCDNHKNMTHEDYFTREAMQHD